MVTTKQINTNHAPPRQFYQLIYLNVLFVATHMTSSHDFNGFGDSIPISISCGHTICNKCVGKINKCLFCRHDIQFKKPNFALVDVLTEISKQNQKNLNPFQTINNNKVQNMDKKDNFFIFWGNVTFWKYPRFKNKMYYKYMCCKN